MIQLLAMHNAKQLLACAAAQLQNLLVGATTLAACHLELRRWATRLNMVPHSDIGVLSFGGDNGLATLGAIDHSVRVFWRVRTRVLGIATMLRASE